MADMALYTAVYESVPPALADLDAIEELHKDAMIGKFDAAVIDQEDGQAHIVSDARRGNPRTQRGRSDDVVTAGVPDSRQAVVLGADADMQRS